LPDGPTKNKEREKAVTVEITKYQKRVVDDSSQPFGTRVLDEYEVVSRWKVGASLKELKKRWKGNPRMEFTENSIKEDLGTYYGIHSYLIMKEVNAE
jgi:hypothetical protein